jgi:uncharacterized surface protein with fasciclin (FAS1) repeats
LPARRTLDKEEFTMKATAHRFRALGAVGLAVVGLAVAGCGSDDSEAQEEPSSTQPAMTATETMEDGNIVETAVAAGNFTTLASLLTEAGLAETLAGGGPFTVFAPTDEAFAAVPQETLDALAADPDLLRSVLLYHVVEGEARASDVASMSSAETLNGDSVSLRANGETVRVNTARVVTADVPASNGVIHVIDEVLIPSA